MQHVFVETDCITTRVDAPIPFGQAVHETFFLDCKMILVILTTYFLNVFCGLLLLFI